MNELITWDDERVVITLRRDKAARLSSSGKMRILAGTGGFQSGGTIEDKNGNHHAVKFSVNVCVDKEYAPEAVEPSFTV